MKYKEFELMIEFLTENRSELKREIRAKVLPVMCPLSGGVFGIYIAIMFAITAAIKGEFTFTIGSAISVAFGFVGAIMYGIMLAGFLIIISSNVFFDFLFEINVFIKNRKVKESEVVVLSRYKLLKLSAALFSAKTQEEVFLPAMADWDEEVYEELKKDKDSGLFMLNVRYTYAFLAAMWQKSPIGDLIQFVVKIAKG